MTRYQYDAPISYGTLYPMDFDCLRRGITTHRSVESERYQIKEYVVSLYEAACTLLDMLQVLGMENRLRINRVNVVVDDGTGIPGSGNARLDFNAALGPEIVQKIITMLDPTTVKYLTRPMQDVMTDAMHVPNLTEFDVRDVFVYGNLYYEAVAFDALPEKSLVDIHGNKITQESTLGRNGKPLEKWHWFRTDIVLRVRMANGSYQDIAAWKRVFPLSLEQILSYHVNFPLPSNLQYEFLNKMISEGYKFYNDYYGMMITETLNGNIYGDVAEDPSSGASGRD